MPLMIKLCVKIVWSQQTQPGWVNPILRLGLGPKFWSSWVGFAIRWIKIWFQPKISINQLK